MKFLHDAAPAKYPLEPSKGATTTSSKFGATATEEAKAPDSPDKPLSFAQIMTKIKNVVRSRTQKV